MKNSILALAALCTFTLSSQAAQWTVSNNSAIPAQFTSLADAQAAAQPGDTLYVQPSTSSYGNLTFTKPLHLIGAGWLQTATREATTLNSLTIPNDIHGGSIDGFSLYSINGDGGDNWQIKNCAFFAGGGITFNGGFSVGWLIQNCIDRIPPVSSGNGRFLRDYSSSGGHFGYITIRNCIITRGVETLEGNGNLIANTMFIGPSYIAIANSTDVTIRNCIFVGSAQYFSGAWGANGCTDCQWWNNISADGGFEFPSDIPESQANIDGVNSEDLFVSSSGPSLNYLEDDFNLLPGSVAEGGGLLGVDIGVYGGSSAFKQNTFYHAWPDTPQILQFGTTNPTLVQGDSLQVGGIVVPGHLN